MEKVRFGIIGAGNIGSTHIGNLLGGKVENGVLSAVADRIPAKIEAVKKKHAENPALKDVTFFAEGDELLASGKCDAVVICVPHYDHPAFAMKALEKGLNVIVEKPAGVYTKQVEEMNAAAAKSDKLFGIMFNQRTNPYFKKMKEIIASGELGEIRRTNWIITDWYRAQTYYDSGDWRATWSGEGGGVLFNQAPHNIDLFWWITGMFPKSVRSFCHFGKWHDIEVEDDVTAYFEYENGATGTFITTTADCPGTNRFEICGSKGKLLYEKVQKKETLTKFILEIDERDYTKTAQNGMKKPAYTVEEVTVEPNDEKHSQHCGILNNFANAVLGIEELYAKGEEGIRGVMLADGMLLSSWKNETVSFPIDSDEYYEELQKRVKTSRRKEAVAPAAVTDLEGTY